jgi:hypothetical protein
MTVGADSNGTTGVIAAPDSVPIQTSQAAPCISIGE